MNAAGNNQEREAEGTGLPGLRTWRAVYVFVLTVVCVWITALALLPFLFS